jgi:iron complex transport system substrate-binding protein
MARADHFRGALVSSTPHPLSRRSFLVQATGLVVVLAACGGDDSSSASTTVDAPSAATTTTTASTTAAPSDPAAFPVTIDHVLGTTTLTAAPTRIVTLADFADLDNLVALGLTPVAYGYSNSWATGLNPWQESAGLGDVTHFDVSVDLPVEQVATFAPDLILAMPYPAEEHYDALTAIAPVVGIAWDASWRDALHLVAAATGTSARADELQADVEAAIADAASQLTAYQGVTIMIGSYYGDVLYVQGAESPVTRLLTDLGLTVKPGPEPVLSELSLEQTDVLADADVLLSLATDPAATAEAEASPLWQQLPAVVAGRYTAIDPTLSRSIADGFNPLSYQWVLPRLVEVITETAEGRGTPGS